MSKSQRRKSVMITVEGDENLIAAMRELAKQQNSSVSKMVRYAINSLYGRYLPSGLLESNNMISKATINNMQSIQLNYWQSGFTAATAQDSVTPS